MAEVWLAEIVHPYDKDEIVGIFASKEEAQDALGNDTKPLVWVEPEWSDGSGKYWRAGYVAASSLSAPFEATEDLAVTRYVLGEVI